MYLKPFLCIWALFSYPSIGSQAPVYVYTHTVSFSLGQWCTLVEGADWLDKGRDLISSLRLLTQSSSVITAPIHADHQPQCIPSGAGRPVCVLMWLLFLCYAVSVCTIGLCSLIYEPIQFCAFLQEGADRKKKVSSRFGCSKELWPFSLFHY